MQGRLSPQSDRGYQVFPWDTWRGEFDAASDRNLEHIEWVLDSWRVDKNPIICAAATVRERIEETGVRVVSVCADYLMDSPLDVKVKKPWETLQALVDAMQIIGAKYLVLPCVDQASLRKSASLDRLRRAAEPLADMVVNSGIRISIESDLGPVTFRHLLEELAPETFGVNYDIGNSASLGYEVDEEFDMYEQFISVVHVKDRHFQGGSVPLGQGKAQIFRAFERLKLLQFDGPVTMQAFRDTQGVDALDRQLQWLQEQMKSLGR